MSIVREVITRTLRQAARTKAVRRILEAALDESSRDGGS